MGRSRLADHLRKKRRVIYINDADFETMLSRCTDLDFSSNTEDYARSRPGEKIVVKSVTVPDTNGPSIPEYTPSKGIVASGHRAVLPPIAENEDEEEFEGNWFPTIRECCRCGQDYDADAHESCPHCGA